MSAIQGILMNLSPHAAASDVIDVLLDDAVARRASDVHIEPHSNQVRVRYRVDGVLSEHAILDSSFAAQIISRLKILAHLDIAERRVPQDGKLQIHSHGRCIDLRVSTFPSLHGEKVVVRILDRSEHTVDLNYLGFTVRMKEQFQELLHKSNGFILVTGPTGSGKTTTLYAALAALDAREKNIITLEDPVEYNVDGITQGQIRPEAGFSFEKGIRALLRQDPDVAMIGEIRDHQTARIAIEAALTGHLVMSTLHTNDAPSAIIRLMDMGIEPFLINAAVTGVLAQRLARTLCQSCRQPVEPTTADCAVMKSLGFILPTIFQAPGCGACAGLGYRGRTGIFELLMVSSRLRALVVQHPLFDAIAEQARRDGMQTLLQDGAQKVADGTISLSELVRVVR